MYRCRKKSHRRWLRPPASQGPSLANRLPFLHQPIRRHSWLSPSKERPASRGPSSTDTTGRRWPSGACATVQSGGADVESVGPATAPDTEGSTLWAVLLSRRSSMVVVLALTVALSALRRSPPVTVNGNSKVRLAPAASIASVQSSCAVREVWDVTAHPAGNVPMVRAPLSSESVTVASGAAAAAAPKLSRRRATTVDVMPRLGTRSATALQPLPRWTIRTDEVLSAATAMSGQASPLISPAASAWVFCVPE